MEIESNIVMRGNFFFERDAVLSPDGRYRYLLRRTWDHNKPRVLFIMLNPSTADAKVDDPTIRSCVRLARTNGYGSIEVINLFAWRATDPTELTAVDDPIGPDNLNVCDGAISRCDLVICAWGAHSMAKRYERDMVVRVRVRKPEAYCFGVTKDGAPKHPLYVKTGTALVVYRP